MFPSSNQTCVCGRLFDNAGAFTRHKKGCQKGKKRLANALKQAKEVYHAKKRRVQGSELLADDSSASLNSLANPVQAGDGE